MSLYAEAVPQARKMLTNLGVWLDQAESYASERGFEVDVLLSRRLYPDMFTLGQQLGAACDNAKFIGARLAGVEPPKHPDTETTLAEYRERIASVQSFLEGLDEAAFEGAEDRLLSPGFLRGGTVTTADYLREFALPNFYFHLAMAYAILRHSGVPLGKMIYIGSMNVRPPA